MASHHARQNVTPFRLTANMAEKRIRDAAVDTQRIKWSKHALDRMAERGFSDIDVLRMLREGGCFEPPEQTPRGEWKAKMVKKLRGARDAGTVVIILIDNCLLVKTVEWEDIR